MLTEWVTTAVEVPASCHFELETGVVVLKGAPTTTLLRMSTVYAAVLHDRVLPSLLIKQPFNHQWVHHRQNMAWVLVRWRALLAPILTVQGQTLSDLALHSLNLRINSTACMRLWELMVPLSPKWAA